MFQKFKAKVIALNSGRFKTYCAIVIAMTMVITVCSFLIVAQLRVDIEDNNQRFNEYFITAVDNNLNGISDFAYNILRSSFSTSITSGITLQNAASLRHEIYMYKNSNRLVDDIIEYFPALDVMVGNNGYFSPLVYYKSGTHYGLNLTYSEEKFQRWMECLFKDKQAGFYQIDEMNGNPAVFYYCSLPNPLNKTDKRVVVVVLSRDGLYEVLKELVTDGEYESALLMDDSGRVYAQYGEKLGMNSETCFDFSSVDSNYTVSKTGSSLLGLNCITIKEKGNAYRLVTIISRVLVTADIIAVCVGVIIAVICAERNRRELYRIASLFKPTQDDELSLEYIEKQIDTLLSDNRLVLEEEEKQQRIVDTAFLRELLDKREASAEEINLITTLYNEDISNDTFLLIAMAYSNHERPHHSAIYKIISELEQENFRIYFAVLKDVIVFMINFDSDTENEQIGKLIKTVKDGTRDFLQITDSFIGVPFVAIEEVPKQWEQLSTQITEDAVNVEENLQEENVAPTEESSEYADPAAFANEIAQREFNNTQLSLQLLAERTGVSQVYLSRVFKQRYGMSVMHYINYLRIEEAKKLIKSGNEPLKVIALKVGFISDINLIRVFKKYENITPGMYRVQENEPDYRNR